MQGSLLKEVPRRSETFLISIFLLLPFMNPSGPNEDFQTAEVRKYAEAIYSATEEKLVKAIVDTLGL